MSIVDGKAGKIVYACILS